MRRFAVIYKGEKQTELYAKNAQDARLEFAKVQARSPSPIADFDQTDVKIQPIKGK